MHGIDRQIEKKPWYKNSNNWAWIVSGLCILAFIVVMIIDNMEEKRAKANRHQTRSYEEIFTPEECAKMGIGKKPDGPGD